MGKSIIIHAENEGGRAIPLAADQLPDGRYILLTSQCVYDPNTLEIVREEVGAGGGGGVTDHGQLTGLTPDDDHPQYHTDARGDARYEVVGAVSGHESSFNHTNFVVAATLTAHVAETSNAHPAVTHLSSTALISGGEMSVNVIDDTTFDIAAGSAYKVNNHTTPGAPSRVKFSWDALEGITDPYLATDAVTFVGLNWTGTAVEVITSNTPFTEQQKRQYISVGTNSHVVGDVIESSDLEPCSATNVGDRFRDFIENFGSFNAYGNNYSAAAADLTVKVSAGKTYDHESNYYLERDNPDTITTGLENPVAELYYSYRDSAGDWVSSDAPLSAVDPDYYDGGVGNGKIAVPASKWTIQTFFRYAAWAVTDVQYGQAVYDSKAEAYSALTSAIAINPWIGDWDTFRDWLVV